MKKLLVFVGFAAILIQPLGAQQWTSLFNGKNLDGWQSRGDAIWTVMKNGTLVGQRQPISPKEFTFPLSRKQFSRWLYTQAWLYTAKDFDQYDLHVEWWLPSGGNSGVSIRDTSRAVHAVAPRTKIHRTPAHIGYEIQINNEYPDNTPSGSIYGLAKAKVGAQRDNQWNSFDIESRRNIIRVKLNGQLVVEYPGDPKRPLIGPIGLQLHDQHSVALFRNIRIRILK